MTRPSAPLLVLAILASVLFLPNDVRAQYLYLDSNGDGIRTSSDVLNPAGPTTVEVWIDTDSNRDGSPGSCPTQDGELTINSYEFVLRATNGTISWGAFTNRQPDFSTTFGQTSSATEFYVGFGGGAILPPGIYHLASLEVAIASGTPDMIVATSSSLSAVHLTSFGSRCSGNDFDNTMKLGSDWFDADGLPYGGAPNHPPTLTQPDPMTVDAESIAHQTLTATDPDGQPLEFLKLAGPHYMTVSTLDAGSGSATGEVTLAPRQSDIGDASGTVSVSDGFTSDEKSFPITVRFGCGEGVCFEQRTVASFLGLHFRLRTGDFNGDSKPDLLSARGGTFEIRMGRGDGNFDAPIPLPVVALPGRIWGFAVADMNGDGRSDVLATSDASQLLDQDHTVHVFLSRGDGTFTSSAAIQRSPATLDHFAPDLVVGDLNGDADMDVVMPRSGGAISVFLGNGDGTLGPATDHPGGFFNGSGVGVLDVNGDGDLDVVRVGSNSFALLLGRGDGTFEAPVTMAGPRNGTFLGSGRIDSDGRDDFAVGSFAAGLQESPVNVFLGRDGIPAPAPPIHVLGLGYQELNVHDMTGDGVPDVVLQIDGIEGFPNDLPPMAGGFSVLVGNGTGTFVDRTDVRLNAIPFRGLTTGDWDLDGRIDVAATLGPTPNIMIFLNRGYRPNSDRPVSIYGNTTLRNVQEGVPTSAGFIADDPDGDPITFSVDSSSLPDGITLETSTPEFPWRLRLGIRADFGTEGEHSFAVLASANGITASWPIRLVVQRGNRPPLADAGGPYEGVVGVPVTLDASGSSDPEGNALTYRWNFGDGSEGVGAVVSHTYMSVRVFQVTLTVRDGATFNSSDFDVTQATIVDGFQAEAYLQGAARTLSLVGSSRPSTCLQIEPSGGAFTPSEIDPATIRMKYAGGGPVSEISAIADRSVIGGDQDRDGVEELTACFRREDMRNLFSTVTGRDTVEVAIEGQLVSGARFRASPVELVVVAGGGPLAATLAPNPLNPRATLSFVSTRVGPARVSIYDVAGRRVRTLLETGELPVGYHEVTVDGLGANGEPLGSGVYFFLIDSAGEVARGRFAILK